MLIALACLSLTHTHPVHAAWKSGFTGSRILTRVHDRSKREEIWQTGTDHTVMRGQWTLFQAGLESLAVPIHSLPSVTFVAVWSTWYSGGANFSKRAVAWFCSLFSSFLYFLLIAYRDSRASLSRHRISDKKKKVMRRFSTTVLAHPWQHSSRNRLTLSTVQ